MSWKEELRTICDRLYAEMVGNVEASPKKPTKRNKISAFLTERGKGADGIAVRVVIVVGEPSVSTIGGILEDLADHVQRNAGWSQAVRKD